MCENFILASPVDAAIRKYHHLKVGDFFKPIQTPALIAGGDLAWVVTAKKPYTIESMYFGFTGHESEKRTDTLGIRIENMDKLSKHDEYINLLGVFAKPHFSEPINSFRCSMLVDAFLATSPDNSTYLIHLQNKERPFAIAGIYDHWKDPASGEYTTGFTTITAESNSLLKSIGVDLMPVILSPDKMRTWLDLKSPKPEFLPLLHTYPDSLMNGYQVSGKIFRRPMIKDYLEPIGPRFKPL